MLVKVLRAAVLLVSVATPAQARPPEACPALFADGRVPVLVNPKLAERTVVLCFDAFAVLHSGLTRTPLYAAERVTRASVADARAVARDDSFHEEDRLPLGGRASLADYVRSGFDRGHLAPAADMPTGAAQAQSFSLANIVPQDRAMNRNLWSDIEESVRRLAIRRGVLYVVTGAVFSGGTVREIGAGVLVPTQLFKAVYDPGAGEAGAYLAGNAADADWRAVSIRELRTVAGIDPFPGLLPAVSASAMVLPEPRALARGDDERPRREARESGWGDWLGRELARIARRALRDLMRAIF